MKTKVKRIISYILIAFVLFFTLVTLLGIWDIIPLDEVIRKALYSLFVVFISSVVVLFIFTVLIKDDDRKEG